MGTLTDEIERVTKQEPVFLLAEIKVRSPRDGDLLRGRDPARLAQDLCRWGADGISVVTEPEHFGGSLDLLAAVREAVECPILAKDFFRTQEAIDAAVARGADAVLLISSRLDDDRLTDLVEYCRSIGVDPLVETHTREELETATALDAALVGINNRDIRQLELDEGGVERTERLAPYVPSNARLVSESSLSSPQEVRRAVDAGADAVLVGTGVLRAEDTAAVVRKLSLQP